MTTTVERGGGGDPIELGASGHELIREKDFGEMTPDEFRLARRLLATRDFTWNSFESAHTRLHLAGDMEIRRVNQLADSIERAREAALAMLNEGEIADEAPIEIFLVETRDDMRRLVGRPISGSGFPDELAAVLVAGVGYRPFFRHELTHSYAAHRWGRRQAGAWLDEGLAALATGACQGHSIDAVAGWYVERGDSPTLDALAGDFYQIPELPGYFTAASLVDFLRHQDGIGAVRSIWRGELAGTDRSHPLGAQTEKLWAEWRRHLATVSPGTLDTAAVGRNGC